MKINQRPTQPNEWLYKQTFVTLETGEMEEQRTDWCTQHIGVIPDNVPPTEWHEYFYRECTDEEKTAYEAEWAATHPETDTTAVVEPNGDMPAEALRAEEGAGV
jgi:hypothetical protein